MSDLTINVEKQQLLRALQTNRDGHAAQYDKAKAGYLRVMKDKLYGLLERVANGELLERAWLESPPEDHTSDYNDVIAMMQWSQDDTIKLTQVQFRQYIQDDWGWQEQWLTSNSAYMQ